MALDTFIAGRYATTYNAVNVGILEEGVELQQDSKAEMLERSDAYADALMDFVYRGGNVAYQFDGLAYAAGIITPFWPWGALGTMATTAAPIGRLASNVASALVLTAAANTPAAAAPATHTASKTILAPNNNARLMYNSKLRKVPIRLLAIPSEAAGTVTWFSQT